MYKKRYVIIGASASGISALQTIISKEPDADVICLSRDSKTANICLLSDVLAKRRPEQDLFFVQDQLQPHIKYNTLVQSIDCAQNRIVIDAGEYIYYDRLLIATGSNPKRLSTYEDDIMNYHTYRDLVIIQERLARGTRSPIILIGAGLSGLELADSLVHLGYEVILLERSPSLLCNSIDGDSSCWLIERLRQIPLLNVRTNAYIMNYHYRDETIRGITLNDGSYLATDLIIATTGVTPADELACLAGLGVDSGIMVNDFLQTSDNSIFAAGDCTQFRNRALVPVRTWPQAVFMGRVAALNMLTIPTDYEQPVSRYLSSFFGNKFISLNFNASQEIVKRVQVENRYISEQINGILMLGDITSDILKSAMSRFRKNL